jgi:excisionase family DNA binding protein
MKTATYPENMNLPTIARYLGVSPITVKRMLKDQEIPAAKVRGRWLFKKAVIDEWLTRNSWSRVKRAASTRKSAPAKDAQHMHPSVARLFAALDSFDFSGLDPEDWDNAKKIIAENRAKSHHEIQKMLELSEQGE